MAAHEQAPDPGADGASPTTCSGCGSDFVHAAEWRREDERRWWFRLRCGGCGDDRRVVLGRADVERLEIDLERGMETIAEAARKLDRERMADEAEVFIAALQHDLIDAADFARAA